MSEATKAVFLSYASQDSEAAKKICDALRGAGVEVWFDAEGGLEHGDEWDAKIRRQIKECVLFLPVISANTQAREEGYFRIEWELAAQRALGIASGVAFILPVVVDGTREPEALVPDRFRTVQWTKLPGGTVPPEVLQRFLKLWSHRTGALKHADTVGRDHRIPPGADKVGFGDPALQKKPSALRYALAALAVLVLGAVGYLVFKPRRSPEEIAKIVAAAPLSEARQLTEKARALSFDKYDSTADDFTAADGLIKHALELDPNDAEIWAVSSQLNKQFQTRGFDRTNARVTAALSQAQRAVKLDPDSIEAQFALGFAERGTDPAASEQIMRQILARQPDHAGALFAMSNLTFRQGKVDEALGYLEKVAVQPKWAALAGYLKYLTYFSRARFAEADQAIRQSIAVEPSANSVAGLAMVLLTWKGDADAAARLFAEAPVTMRNEPRTIWMTAEVQLCRRAPDEALNVLDRLPDEYIQDSWLSAPKAYYVGRAQALAGRPEAARVAWEAGLAIMQARLKSAPANPDLHLVNGELLALLGRNDEALREARTVTELSRGEKQPWFISPVRIYAELGRADDALPLLAGLCPSKAGDNVGWPLTPALLRLDPIWDKIRNDPRFQQLCTAPAPVTQVTDSPPAAAGPQNPELKRALQLVNSPEAIASDIALAEDITKSVLAARPTDTEATIVMGRIQVYYLVRGFDRSEDRFATAKHYAERAMALAPDDPDAQAVMATYLYRRNVELPRAEKLLRAAIAQRPGEPLYYRMLDNVLSDEPGVSDAVIIASAKVTAERFPADALVQYELARHYRDAGMLEESEHYLDVAIKLGPVANAIIARARLNLFVHGDPAGMKAMLDTLPDRYHGTDRAVFSQFSYALATRQPELGLDALQVLPEAWMIDFDYTGPTALLAGELLLQEDKAELARLRFTEALAELGRHKADFSRNFSTTWLETWLLMRLGRLDEARKRNDVFFPELVRPFHMNLGTNWWFNPITQSLLLGEPAKALALMHEAVDFPQGRAIFRNALRLDPRMAPFRDDPEIKALLAEPAAKK